MTTSHSLPSSDICFDEFHTADYHQRQTCGAKDENIQILQNKTTADQDPHLGQTHNISCGL